MSSLDITVFKIVQFWLKKKLKTLLVKNKTKVLSYGIKTGDIRATEIEYSNLSTSFQIKYKKQIYQVKAPVVGEFNVYNLLAVIASLIASGYSTLGQTIDLTGYRFEKFLRLGCSVAGVRDTLWLVVTPLVNSTIDGFHGSITFIESD